VQDIPGHTPVLVGAGQYVERGATAESPSRLAARAAAAALADAGGAGLAGAIDTVAVVRFFADSSPLWSCPFGRSNNPPQSVARAIGARRDEVVFTSGGTEANALAVLGGARARREKGRHVLVGPTEHACVRESALALAREGFEVETLRLDARGALDLEHAAGRMRADTVLVAQMLVQNEVGTIYPVRELARAVRARSKHALVHVDAVQALGKVPVELAGANAPRVDYASFSAHKLHGPKGAGALWVRPGSPFTPRQRGGAQEQGRRAGTENLPALVGFGRAAELARAWLAGPGPTALAALRDRFEAELVRRAGPVRLHARGARCRRCGPLERDCRRRMDGAVRAAESCAVGLPRVRARFARHEGEEDGQEHEEDAHCTRVCGAASARSNPRTRRRSVSDGGGQRLR